MRYFKFLFICLVIHSSIVFGATIGIMAVGTEELGDIESFFQGPYQKYEKGMRTFYKGHLWGHDTVVVLCNVGKVAAASATVDLINEEVDLIFFIGTAGAIDKRLNIGDVVVADGFVDCDAEFRRFHDTDNLLNPIAIKAITKFFGNESSKVVFAPIGTVDHFLVTQEELNELVAYVPEVVSLDMESSAVAHVASDYEVPLVVIRTVSNYIDTPSADHNFYVAMDYNEFLKNVQVVYAENILRHFFENLRSNDCKVGILCSGEVDLKAFFDEEPKQIIRGKQIFYDGLVNHCRVVLTQPRMGKVAVASTAEAMISEDHVKALIVVGSACPMDERVKIGDIVVSNAIVDFDMDVRPFRPQYELPTLGITNLPAEASLIPLGNVTIGKIASGDKAKDKVSMPDLLCIDYDSAPAAQVAYQWGVPFLSIKQISEYDETLEKDLLEMLLKVISRIH